MAEVIDLICECCGEKYTYDDEASPKYCSIVCGLGCAKKLNLIN